MTQAKSSHALIPQPLPGYLMAPFGWAAKSLVAMLEADPSLYRALFTLNRQRMHLIALALAHWPGESDPSRGRLLLGGAPAAVLDRIVGRRPAGLKRALGRLPVSVLPPESYRHLTPNVVRKSAISPSTRVDRLDERCKNDSSSVLLNSICGANEAP